MHFYSCLSSLILRLGIKPLQAKANAKKKKESPIFIGFILKRCIKTAACLLQLTM